MTEASPSIGPEDYEKHALWLRRLARGLVSDPAAADDVVQETWASALRRRPGRDRPLRPWLARTARNAAKKSTRTEGRRRQREALSHESDVPVMTPAELAETADLAHTLMGEVRGLSEPYRSTVLQRYMQGLSSAEIARRAGVPEGTVRSRLAEAREQLRERMDRKVGSRAQWVALAEPVRRAAATSASTVGSGAATAVGGGGLPWGVILPIVVAAGVLAAVGMATFWLYQNRHRKAERTPEVEVSSVEILDAIPEGPDQLGLDATSGVERTELDTIAVGEAPAPAGWNPDGGEAVIRVRVLNEASEPLEGARVSWPEDADVFGQSDEAGLGTLLFRPPADGTAQEFLIEANGYASATLRGVPFAGEVTDLGSVLMMRACRRTGVVLDSQGEPAAGVQVGAIPLQGNRPKRSERKQRDLPDRWPGTAIREVRTGEDGSFVLEGVPLRPMQLWAAREDTMCTVSAAIQPGTRKALRPVTMTIVPLPVRDAIKGTLTGPGGASAEGSLLRLMSLDGSRVLGEVEPDVRGKFSLLVRERGDFLLRATDLLDRWEDEEQEVSTGQPRVLMRFKKKL